MAYDSVNKRLYVDTASGKGISTSEIATCLGDYRVTQNGRSIGLLCTSPKVNMWSKNKPVRTKSFSPLTYLQRQQANYGLDVSKAHDTEYEDLLGKAISSSCKFGYLAPRGGENEPFRLLDFDGYWHKAETPYKYRLSHQKGEQSVWADMYIAPKADLTIADLNPTDLTTSDIGACNIIILFRKKGQTSGGDYVFPKVNGSYVKLRDIKTSDYAAPVLRFDVPSAGEWDVVLAVTTATEVSTEDEFYMFLPEALFELEYIPNYIGFYWKYWDEDSGVYAKIVNGEVDTLTVNMGFEMDEEFDKAVSIVLKVEAGSSLTDFDENSIEKTSTFTLSPNEYKEVSLVFDNIGSYIAPNGGLTTSSLYVRASIDYTVGETTRTVYFDFLEEDDDKGQQKATYQQPVTVKEIYNKWGW
jgi:hypothetical protein